MNRIAYFLTWSQGNTAGPGEGVRRKICHQLTRWRSLGWTVRLFIAATRPCSDLWASHLEAGELEIRVYRSRWQQLLTHFQIYRSMLAYKPDCLYLRQEMWTPGVGLMLRAIPSCMEINGDELAEAASAPPLYRLLRRLSRPLMLAGVRGLVSVAAELLEIPDYRERRVAKTVIANGIPLEDFEPMPAPKNARPRLAFLGSPLGAMWHGVDKIIDLARVRPDWDFDIIGMNQGDLGSTVPANVQVHGMLDRASYQPILALADIALGTLSGHRKKAFEISALKVREYLAFGIPTITGARDTDFPEGCEGVLELPNCQDNVMGGLDKIDAFVSDWCGRRVRREHIQKLDSNEKEKKRLNFLKELSLASRLPTRHASKGLSIE